MLRRLLDVARPAAHFPDPRRLDTHLSLLGPAGSHGVLDALEVDPGSGLPTLRQLVSVRAERDLALEEAREAGPADPGRAAWHADLRAAALLPVSSVTVRLRRRDARVSQLEIVHDRIDAASGCLLRYTVRLGQRGARHVGLRDDDTTAPSQRFVRLIERNAGADAELALLLLADLPGARVEEVVRGQVGPLHFAGLPLPGLLAPVLAAVPGAFVLHLGLERAGAGVARDRCRDPFSRLYRETLSAQARAPVEARRAALGYRVSKERRLVCTPSAEGPLKAALARAGTPLVVRCA